jgi:hypothetical protein
MVRRALARPAAAGRQEAEETINWLSALRRGLKLSPCASFSFVLAASPIQQRVRHRFAVDGRANAL